MRSEDLVPLLDPDRGLGGMTFSQGTVVWWDPTTGRNTISVAGTELEDLPILNTGEAIALKVGHIVGIARWRSQWFILGRITIPGSTQFASSSVAFDSNWGTAAGFAVPSGGGNVVVNESKRIIVPPWADEAMVTVTGFAKVNNTTGGLTNVFSNAGIRRDGVAVDWTNSQLDAVPADYWITPSVGITRVVDVSTASYITGYVGMGNGLWVAHTDNRSEVNIAASFRAIA